MKEVDEHDLGIICYFIGSSWRDFVSFCEEHSENGEAEAERIYKAIGGEE